MVSIQFSSESVNINTSLCWERVNEFVVCVCVWWVNAGVMLPGQLCVFCPSLKKCALTLEWAGGEQCVRGCVLCVWIKSVQGSARIMHGRGEKWGFQWIYEETDWKEKPSLFCVSAELLCAPLRWPYCLTNCSEVSLFISMPSRNGSPAQE